MSVYIVMEATVKDVVGYPLGQTLRQTRTWVSRDEQAARDKAMSLIRDGAQISIHVAEDLDTPPTGGG